LRGVIRFLQGNMSASFTEFAEASKLAPLSDADAFTEAMASVSLGDLIAARKLLEQLSGKYPERPIYVYWLGKLDYDQRRYDESVIELQRAVALDPKSARSWDSLGLTFDMQGRSDQARDALEKAVALNREQTRPSPWPPHNLGYLLLRMNRPQEAEAALRESLRYDPAFEQSHYHLGRALEKEGREPEAIQEYLTAVNADANASDACYSLALLYRKLHRDSEADKMFAEYKRRKQAP
jgi:tetratricopeptide (TPR) repeat protein